MHWTDKPSVGAAPCPNHKVDGAVGGVEDLDAVVAGVGHGDALAVGRPGD